MSFLAKIGRFKGVNRPAIVFRGKTVTYDELHCHVAAMAAALAKRRFTSGRVALALPNDPHHVVAALAILKLGLTFIEIPLETPKNEFDNLLGHAQPDLLITADGFRRLKNSAVHRGGAMRLHVQAPSRMACVFFTSGSTGKPKGIMKSYKTFAESMKNRIATLGVTEHSVLLCCEPLNYTMGLLYLLSGLFAGAQVILAPHEKGRVRELMRLLGRVPLTHLYACPSVMQEILTLSKTGPPDFSHLEFVGSIGDIITPGLKRLVHATTGRRLTTLYGQTKTGLVFSQVDDGRLQAREPIGIPVSPEVKYRIIGGELCLKSPFVFDGYLDDASLTRSVFTRKGWFRTGDLVVKGRGGRLFFAGRLKSMITLIDGENVSPLEVEEAVLETGLASAAVVTSHRQDEATGEVIHCHCILEKGIAREEFLKRIRPALARRIAGFKIPSRFVFEKKLKLNSRGKTDRRHYASRDALRGKRIF